MTEITTVDVDPGLLAELRAVLPQCAAQTSTPRYPSGGGMPLIGAENRAWAAGPTALDVGPELTLA